MPQSLQQWANMSLYKIISKVKDRGTKYVQAKNKTLEGLYSEQLL